MMNKTLHILTILLLLMGVDTVACAQDPGQVPDPAAETPKRPRVMILGNVYGGGELAQVIAPDAATAAAQLIQDADLADLFTTHADHVYTTYVHLGDNSEVYGRVFGGGKGQHDDLGESAGRVTGQTDVALDGATVWSEIYGGGEMADVRGNTLLHFKKGKAGHNAFGGGLGKLGKREHGNPGDALVELGIEDNLADNRYEPLASADIKKIPAQYSYITDDNADNLTTLKGLDLNTAANWMAAKKTGESFVVFDGTEVDGVATYTHYEFKTARTVNRDANGKPLKSDGLYYTETNQFNPERPEQLFSINHNIYGGGMTASQVEGKTFVHINYGMVNQEMMDFDYHGTKVWSMIYNSIANAQFCVFGGGYGYYTDILGDTNVNMIVGGSGEYHYLTDFKNSFYEEWDKDERDPAPDKIAKAADHAKWSHGAPGRSCMDIVGGGYNGRVRGTTNVTVGGDVVLRKVYGGGYYASVGNTNVNLYCGVYNRVYGGGLIGNVYGTATLNYGLAFAEDDPNYERMLKANKNLLVKDAIYGGNDVSGTVGTSAATVMEHQGTGVHYNAYSPVDGPEKGVVLNIHGGTVFGDVYGAGNGNHPGYGNPDYMEFSHSQHPSENYRQLAHTGTKGTGLVYKYRPRTARVVMNISGNDGTDFNDDNSVDKVRIWGRTFGGGNSCNVGVWDGTADDTAEVYADDATSWHPGDNFLGGGTIEMNIGSHVQLGNRNDSHDTPNGLFMGSNGEHMITQHTDKELAKYYHQYYDVKAGKYYPGFMVYEDDNASQPIKRTTGLKAFKAFINNILTKTDNVSLNIKNADDTAAADVWMSNFVGGGYRGSMQAATATGRFDYTLPEGVTVGHAVVGGAFNAHVIYRVYKTNYETGEYSTDDEGNYQYETVEPAQGVLSKAEAEAFDIEHGNPIGTTPYDYIKKLYEEGHEGEEAYKTGYLRYNFDGGMLAHDSEMNAAVTGSRIHQVHANPNEDGITADERAARFATSYFEPLTEGAVESEEIKNKLFTKNKEKALVHLDLKCALQPMVHDQYDPILKTEHTVHGGVVYGGCYATGFIEGDTWVDYGCWLSPLCSEGEYFDKNDNMAIYGDVANLDHVSAMMVFGAGYGADTHSMGDVYVRIKSIANAGDAGGDKDKFGKFPYIYNAFGGGNMGTVAGNTNVYYAAGVQGTLLGSLYGGGYKGRIDGNTFVELAEGFVTNCYGGSRQADVGGASHVWAYDGKYRGVPDAKHLIICNLYGGNDVAGTIGGTMPATWAANKWETSVTDYCPTIKGGEFSTYVEISSDDNSANSGFPLIGSVFAGGNGAYDYTSETIDEKPNPYYGWTVPTVRKTLLEIDGGSTLRAFGGGNNATVTDSVHILTDAHSTNFANVEFAEYQKNIMQKVFFNGQQSGYRWEGTRLRMNDTHVFRLFGGNNLADMAIQPKWNLQDGHIENVYSGGNMGNMTYYNPAGVEARTDIAPNTTPEGKTTLLGVENDDGTNVNANPKGLSITINSPTIRIGSLFGGCRMSDVRANDARPAGHEGEWQTWPDFEHGGEDCYGATVNVIDGNIGYIFGGNDVSGQVVHGTNINICGGVIGQVYGSGNGDFLYKYIPATPGDDPLYTDAEKADTRITEHLDDEHGLYYTVPEMKEDGINPWDNSSTGDTHKIMTINKVRPSVDNTFINIAGLDAEHSGTGAKRTTLIKGNVYVGGNATTITRGNEEAFSKFKYGSYAVANGLYFGSDGFSYTQDETITKFAKLNGITDMGAETSFPDDSEDKEHNPILLNAYLTAVDMEALPKEFAIPTTGLRETYVGTVCGGGNRGSMLTNRTVDLVIPAQIVVFDKVVAGCNDATVNYNQGGTTIKSVGGYTRPIEDHTKYGNTKIRYNIAAQFVPLTLDVPMGTDLKVPVNRTDLNNHDETWADAIQHAFLWPRLNSTGDGYTTGCNIYGGCYSSGEMEGDVELNIHSNMLRYADEAKLQKAIENNEICFNVFGAGFGQDSHVWGNVHIKMDKSDNVRLAQPELSPVATELLASPYLNGQNQIVTNYATPSVNNLCGGGRNGQLIGNTTLEVRNGRVYSDVIGGCFASNMYGSSQVIVGYPTYYRCNTSGEYQLQRGDQWNGDKNAIKTSVKYLKGDLVPKNVYEQIVAHTAGNAAYFTDATIAAPTDWGGVNIQIGEGIYGGGYSLANSTAASAGSITTHKLQATPVAPADLETLHPLNFDCRYGLEAELSTVGYGGNSAIMVGDQAGDGTADHISISTLIATEATIPAGGSVIGKFILEDNGQYTHQSDGAPVGGKQYYDLAGYGGIYGDGHLTFCEGFRAADVYGYGYNTATVKYPKLMNTFQRLDLLDVSDCCLMLQGSQDFTTNSSEKLDATIYSMTRIDELRMKSSLDAANTLGQVSAVSGSGDGAQQNTVKQRNYLGFFNNVHFLGSIVTNDDFASAAFHGKDGVKGSTDYKAEKASYISTYSSSDKGVDATNLFKKRNVGTARNVIGINNGYCLRIQNQYDDNGTKHLYYGPIVGVCEVKLLTLTQGEGGGYVYADNVHEGHNATSNGTGFLNVSGNFVFPGVVGQGNDGEGHPIADQYIVDDCFVTRYGSPQDITTPVNGTADEAHYWYVEGNKYFYNTTLTGYTFQDPITFNLIDTDPNVVLSGMEDGSMLKVKKIEWLSAASGYHRGGYEPVLYNQSNPSKTDDYEFDIDVNGASWTANMPRYNDPTAKAPATYNSTNTPIFNVRLQDRLDNSGDDNYTNHLDEPELVKIYLEGQTGVQTYEYTITLNIVYLQGPTYSGGVNILNCALPGERIGFSSGGIKIKTPDLMPVTAASWQILPLKEIDEDGNWKWDETKGVDIPRSQYSEVDGVLTGWVPALYKQNEYNIAYTFTAGGHQFPVMPDQHSVKKQNRMIVVHNYHRMKDVVPQNLQIETMLVVPNNSEEPHTVVHPDYAQAKIYIEDEADLRAFINYLNMSTHDNANKIPEGLTGLDIILQKDITLTQALPAINVSFAGNFHGDGYHVDLGTYGTSLFGGQLSGKVYNLGLINGTISTVDTKDASGIVNGDYTDNSYEYTTATDVFKYGKNAYDLSHHFVEHGHGADYVERYYANGDYQYATTDRVWSLRTGDPNYGSTVTRHDVTHTHDADRWIDFNDDDDDNNDILCHTGHNVPLHDGTQTIADVDILDGLGNVIGTKRGVPAPYANDYLFFGQHLDKTNADAYPVHIEPIAKGDADNSKGGNRVYKTSGFYGSAADNGFYYNRDAWALQPTLTAIDFTFRNNDEKGHNYNEQVFGRYDEGDDTSTSSPTDDINQPKWFHVDSNADYNGGTYDNASYGHVSQNLIVVGENAEENSAQAAVLAAGIYGDGTPEEDIRYHRAQLKNGATGVYEIDYFHLVDKQDYNSPVSYTVNQRAWYERYPQAYRNVTPDSTEPTYQTPSAWEGITLPFQYIERVSGEPQTLGGHTYENVLSHFYGETTPEMEANPAINDRTLHHEYWLTGLVGADGDKATFARPTGTNGTDNFYIGGLYAVWTFNYQNDYYRHLSNYGDYSDTRDDDNAGADAIGQHSNDWYFTSHAFAEYPRQNQGTPYLCAFPGDDFYEFSLEGQKITFEKVGKSIIAVTDVDMTNYGTTTVGTHKHVGTYQHVAADAQHLGMNATGSAFEVQTGHILPFRTYMTTTATSSPHRIVICDGGQGAIDVPVDEDINIGDLSEPTLLIYSQGTTIVVESNYDTELRIYTPAGRFVQTLHVTSGRNIYEGFHPDIYIVGGKKLRLTTE